MILWRIEKDKTITIEPKLKIHKNKFHITFIIQYIYIDNFFETLQKRINENMISGFADDLMIQAKTITDLKRIIQGYRQLVSQ